MSRYTFQPPPSGDLDIIRRWLEQELEKIRGALDALYDGEMESTRTEPARPRYGTITIAEPNGWDPGSGPGFYGYEGTTTASGTWVKF